MKLAILLAVGVLGGCGEKPHRHDWKYNEFAVNGKVYDRYVYCECGGYHRNELKDYFKEQGITSFDFTLSVYY